MSRADLSAAAGSHRGTALVGTAAGVLVFLVFLLFALQLSVNLYATSVVSAVGLDAARAVAAGGVDHRDPGAVRQAEGRAETHARQVLGRSGRRVHFTWSVGPERVRLRLRVVQARFLPVEVDRSLGLDAVDRTFSVRVERFR
ncbi:MAG: hypothetical protein JWN46_1908 [Acidimicrobiales bacterium]|nr:hypothetical protein [Acidimicrobiales bacterium]